MQMALWQNSTCKMERRQIGVIHRLTSHYIALMGLHHKVLQDVGACGIQFFVKFADAEITSAVYVLVLLVQVDCLRKLRSCVFNDVHKCFGGLVRNWSKPDMTAIK